LITWFLFFVVVLAITAFAHSGVDLHWPGDDRGASYQGHHHTEDLLLFLENHCHLNDEYVIFYVDLFTRIAIEVRPKEA
jgi:hypothetical protein